MAELSVFGYHAGNSRTHQLDIRFKLLFLIVISVVSLKAGLLGLLSLSLFLAAVMRNARLGFERFFKEIRYFLVLIVFVISMNIRAINKLLPIL